MNKTNVHITDLTTGHSLRVITIYAIPMLISMFFQQTYNLIDGWIAGTQIGSIALGAVGTCYPVTVLFIAVASGLSLGTSLICSSSFGAKDYGKVKTCISTSYVSFVPLSVVMSFISFVSVGFILYWLGVPEEATNATQAYLRMYIIGLPFLFVYNISNGILNGLGDSRTPLIFLIISSVCNVFLDLLFVVIIPLGITGLALATVLSQAAAAVCALITVKKVYFSQPGAGERWSHACMKEILSLGIPSMVQHVFMAVGQLTIQNVINSYGLIVMAGYSVAFRINGIVVNSIMALANALSGYIAQNRGAGKNDRIVSGLKYSLILAYTFTALTVLLLLSCGETIIAAFIQESSESSAVIAAGMQFFRIVSPFYLVVCAKIIFDGCLRGIGAMRAFMFVAIIDVVIRIGCGQLFSNLFGIIGVWSVWPVAWFFGTTASISLYFYLNKRAKGKVTV